MSNIYTSTNSSGITQLEKQLTTLQKELKTENVSKEDVKTKLQKLNQIQQRIQQVEAQIQQIKAAQTNQGQSSVRNSVQADGKINGVGVEKNLPKALESNDSISENRIDLQV